MLHRYSSYLTVILTAVFSDDAEVQRQKMVPVLIGDGHDLPLAHLDSPWSPPIHLFVHRSLQAFFTGTLGSFFPSTMLNTVLTSVLGWNWGVERGEGQPQREQIIGVLLYVLVSLFISVQPLLWGGQSASLRHLPNVFHCSSSPVHRGPVFKPRDTAEKRQIPTGKKKQKTTNSKM